VSTSGGPPGAVRIATLNCRNTADRWRRRRGLLVRQLVELEPHVIGLQELRSIPDQGAWIGRYAQRRSPGRQVAYRRYRTYKTGLWGFWEGIGTLSRLPVVDTASVGLGGQFRVAQRVTVELPAGGRLEVYNAHLVSGDEAERHRQAERLLAWMDEHAGAAQVLLGDFNATPAMGSIQLVASRLRSSYAAVHGAEPPRTLPTPLRVGAHGDGVVMDYIFVNDRVEVHDAAVVFTEVDPHDPHLVASDHYGLTATVSVRAGGAGG
jgi:endonuclease/exonuclease/phosphatase family metal-dependent hydrolase